MQRLPWIIALLLLAACEGLPGRDGRSGQDGVDGRDGSSAADGNDGVDGSDGVDGVDGDDGVDGQDGQDGQDGEGYLGTHVGLAPWGMHLAITGVDGASGAGGAFQIGDRPKITVLITDDGDIPYTRAELDAFGVQLSGPSDHYQPVLPAVLQDPAAEATFNADGSLTYVFSELIPTHFAAPAHDTLDLSTDQGEWQGIALVDGTYTFTAWAGIEQTRADGTTFFESDGDALDVLLGDASSLNPREVVNQDGCSRCHGQQLYEHSGLYDDVRVCVTCHVAGAEDAWSEVDPSTTPGATIEFGPMVHGIHMGSGRATPLALNRPDALLDFITRDFSGVSFPVWPIGAASCDTCHGGAADGYIYDQPNRRICGSCHDWVDFQTGAGHATGLPQADDSLCGLCHIGQAVEDAHADPRLDPLLNAGLAVAVSSVIGGSGANGQFVAGDTVTVHFSLKNDAGTTLLPTDLDNLQITMGGPVEHMQRLAVAPAGDPISAAVYDSVSDTYAYSFTLPATYPAQANDTAAIGLEQGDWQGQALVDGTYRVAVMGAVTVDNGSIFLEQPASAVAEVLVGSATSLSSHDVVREANCQRCHERVEHHDGAIAGLGACTTCHTAGAEDAGSSADPSSTPGVSIALQALIHKIHAGATLSKGFELMSGSGLVDYSAVVFPRRDGNVQACVACHQGSDAWKDASAAVCTTCHDSQDAAAHASLNTDPLLGEACDVCHGVGRTADVEASHDWQR